MDIQGLISELGVPIAMSIAMLWGCFYLIKYITGNLTEMLVNRFEELRAIIITLISQQKELQIKNAEWASDTKALVKFIVDLQAAKDEREEKRILKKYKKDNGG